LRDLQSGDGAIIGMSASSSLPPTQKYENSEENCEDCANSQSDSEADGNDRNAAFFG
jgi:hypothetical protein